MLYHSAAQSIQISVYQSFSIHLSKVDRLSEFHCIFNKILALAEKERGFVVLQAHTFFSMQSWAVIQPQDCLELGKEPLWKSSKEMLLWNRQLKSLILSHPLQRILNLQEKKHWWLSTMEKRGQVGYSSIDPLLWKSH